MTSGANGRKLTGAIAALIASAIVLLAAAEASAKTPASVRAYGDSEWGTTGISVAFGQVFSGKRECYSQRRFKFVAKIGGKRTVLDTGRTSVDGAISGGYDNTRVGDGPISYSLGKTEKCAATKASARPEVMPLRGRAAVGQVGTGVLIVAINGIDKDGALAGLIGLDRRAKCFEGRKMKMLADGKLVDRGTTNFGGSYALHLTSREAGNATKIVVKVGKSKLPNGTVCGASKTTLKLPG